MDLNFNDIANSHEIDKKVFLKFNISHLRSFATLFSCKFEKLLIGSTLKMSNSFVWVTSEVLNNGNLNFIDFANIK